MGPSRRGVPASPTSGGQVTKLPPAPPAWAWPRWGLFLWRKERGVCRVEKTPEAETSREEGRQQGARFQGDVLWAGPAGLTGRGASTRAWREGGMGRGAETRRDHQPRRAPAASGTTGLCCLEDGSSWAGHGLFPALPTGYASLNGVRLQGRPHPREPGPGKLSGPAGEARTHFQQAGREGPRGPGALLCSGTHCSPKDRQAAYLVSFREGALQEPLGALSAPTRNRGWRL